MEKHLISNQHLRYAIKLLAREFGLLVPLRFALFLDRYHSFHIRCFVTLLCHIGPGEI